LLIQTITTSPSEAHRALANVLLRKLLTKLETWTALGPAAQAAVRDGLLAALTGEPTNHVRHKACHAIAEVAVKCAGPGAAQWPELLPRIFTLASAPEPRRRESALYLFTRLGEYAGDVLLVPHAEQLRGLLGGLLADADNGVRIAALKGAVALAASIPDDGLRNSYQALIPAQMKASNALWLGSSAWLVFTRGRISAGSVQ
jgi:hypothetical protein